MKVGTKSLLFGVHQFLWHPLVVTLAWREWHGRWPQDLAEWVAILVHDWGYWGCSDMDGTEGRAHPFRSAEIAWKILKWNKPARRKAMKLVLGHSKYFAGEQALSELYAPDKISVLFEPRWFYVLRGLASGEIWEFIEQAPRPYAATLLKYRSPMSWFNWYRAKTIQKFYDGNGKLRELRVRSGDARDGVDLSRVQTDRREGSGI